jgi:hypothetical protein
MDLFGYLRRFTRVILLGLISLVTLKILFCCTPMDVIILIGLFLILLALISTPCC